MSDSEDDEIFESLMASRARRSNAGSRLKQLIALEEQSTEAQNTNQFVTEEDENVNLLFQDDEDDQEFIDEELDNENLLGIDEDEEDDDEDDENETNINGRKRRQSDIDDDDEEEDVNMDEVLSDSDISASDSDASEGERELQKQERVRKKRKKTIIPTIKKLPTTSPKKVKKSPLITSDSLLLSSRRSSSRSAAVESKQALVDRLKESEKRKAKYVHVEKKKVKEPTQEERLVQAIETEKENIESLNKFKEQEIVKKERQRQSLLSKRLKLKNVIRIISKQSYVTPDEEVASARKEFEIYMKKRRRLSKRKKGASGEEESPAIAPFSIDYSSPYQQAIIAERKKVLDSEIDKVEEMNLNLMEKLIEHNNESNGTDNIANGTSNGIADDVEKKVDDVVDIKKASIDGTDHLETNVSRHISNNDENNKNKMEEVDKEVEEENANAESSIDKANVSEKKTAGESELMNDNNSKNGSIDETQKILEEQNVNSNDKIIIKSDEALEKNSSIKSVDSKDNESIADRLRNEVKQEEENTGDNNQNSSTIKEVDVTASVEPEIKRVKFADDKAEPQYVDASPQPEEISLKALPHPSKEVFEGPVQKICRNLVSFLDFDEDKKDLRLNPTNMKALLFGKQSLLPASRRFNDVKTIIHIGKVENPYAIVQKDKPDDSFTSAFELNEDDPMFDELKKLPRLGVAQDIIEEEEDTKENESTEIKINTEAPTGLYLPNGNKKICMISGTEVKYYDPSTGMPYSSVETYKILKLIEQGQAQWLSLDRDSSNNGPFDLYLGFKGENFRSAKGVPEGFDG
ncbi:uncharacterized protein KGF55_002857 [Candida pseudojiufengensis]|uniref:uncharacterized protein n=1 Tax=Candida pseudojiufengensis TaxID=497109 RepID=UPI002225AB9A|nr:uncharacterized protein KGF55_002857 [Candida pseudojiufengensis]KAI5963065.1 hypothetical protein KGF55_002857 [Candida pseudojiufengensis]